MSKTKNKPIQCPLCLKLGYAHATTFKMGIAGWAKHVRSVTTHPEWYPKVKDPAKRKALFQAEFPDFEGQGLTKANAAEQFKKSNARRYARTQAAKVAKPGTREYNEAFQGYMRARMAQPVAKKSPTNGRLETPGVLVPRAEPYRSGIEQAAPATPPAPAAPPVAPAPAKLDYDPATQTVACPSCGGSGRLHVQTLPAPTAPPQSQDQPVK